MQDAEAQASHARRWGFQQAGARSHERQSINVMRVDRWEEKVVKHVIQASRVPGKGETVKISGPRFRS